MWTGFIHRVSPCPLSCISSVNSRADTFSVKSINSIWRIPQYGKPIQDCREWKPLTLSFNVCMPVGMCVCVCYITANKTWKQKLQYILVGRFARQHLHSIFERIILFRMACHCFRRNQGVKPVQLLRQWQTIIQENTQVWN